MCVFEYLHYKGGESTRQEMCQALLYYYPRIELTNCGSFPDPNTAHRPFLQDVLMWEYNKSVKVKATFSVAILNSGMNASCNLV